MQRTTTGKITFTNLNNTSAVNDTYAEFDASGFDDVYIYITGSGTPNWVVRLMTGEKEVDFTAAASNTNEWTYINSRNTLDDAAISGASNITVNTATPLRIRINDYYNGKIGIKATRTAGSIKISYLGVVRGGN